MQYCSQCKNLYPTEMQFCPRHGTPLERRDELSPGMVVREKYEILEELGSGGMGTVFRVKDLDFAYGRNQSAMKVPSAQLAAGPEFVRRFRDEAAKARVLNHPNVVRIEHIDRMDSGTPFLVMELVEGRSLRWWMQQNSPLSWQTSVEIAKEVALALEAAHAAGLVHCDIKPENVMTVTKTAPLPLKVTDFGLAKATDVLLEKMTRVQTGTSWGTGLVVGTPEYMSPEQARGREHVGPPSDVYSLGVMLFELLSGTIPYGKIESIEDARQAHEKRQPASLRGHAELPPGICDLLEEMLDRFPERRPATATVAARLVRLQKKTVVEQENVRATVNENPPRHEAGSSGQDKSKQNSVGECNHLGLAYLRKGQYDAAAAKFREALRLQPGYAAAHNNLGLTFFHKGEHAAAIAEYREALRLKSDLLYAHNNLGEGLLNEGLNDEALAAFRTSLLLNPKLMEAHNGLGRALYRKQDYDEAIAAYRAALRIDPNHAMTHNNLGVALFDKGEFGSAVSEYREALRLKPDIEQVPRNLRIAEVKFFERTYIQPLLFLACIAAAVAKFFVAFYPWNFEISIFLPLAILLIVDVVEGLRKERVWAGKFRRVAKPLLALVFLIGPAVLVAYRGSERLSFSSVTR